MIALSDTERRRRSAASLGRLRPALAVEAERCLSRGDAVAFLARLDLWFVDVHGQLEALYGKSVLTDRGPDQAVDEAKRSCLRCRLEVPERALVIVRFNAG